MDKKYELLESEERIIWRGRKIMVHRIRALIDIPEYGIKVGDIGGYVESEKNLSQKGICWILDNAIVCGNARIIENALVGENAIITDDACIGEYAQIMGHCKVYERARVYGNVRAYDNAIICGMSRVAENAILVGNDEVCA